MSLDLTPVHRNLHTKVTFLGLEFEDLILVLALAALMNLLAHFASGNAHVLGIRRDRRQYVPGEEMIEYRSAREQATEASILNETETYLNIDGYLYGVVSLKELPDATFPGMLQNFSTLGFPIVISGQVVIPDQVKVLKSYKKRLQKMTAAQKDANGNFKSNPEAEVAQAQLIQVQRDIIPVWSAP